MTNDTRNIIAFISEKKAESEFSAVISSFCDKISMDFLIFENNHDFIESDQLPTVIIIEDVQADEGEFVICKKLGKKKSMKFVPFVLASNQARPNETYLRMADQAGFSSIVQLSMHQDDIHYLLNSSVNQFNKINKINEKYLSSKQTAFQAMEQSQQVMSLINFVTNTTDLNSYQNLASSVLQYLKDLGFLCSIMFHVSEEELYYNLEGDEECRVVEKNIMMKMRYNNIDKKSSKFFITRGKAVISFNSSSMYIKECENPPIENHVDFFGYVMNIVELLVEKIILIKESKDSIRRFEFFNASQLMEYSERLHSSIASLDNISESLDEIDKMVLWEVKDTMDEVESACLQWSQLI